MRRVTLAFAVASVALAVSSCGSEGPEDVSGPTSAESFQDQSRGLDSANAFVALAAGKVDEVPWGSSVDYYVGGVRVGTFTPGPNVPRDLSTCLPGKAEVEGHTCPISPIKTISENAGKVVVESSVPARVGCNVVSRPEIPDAWIPTVIRPTEGSRNCFDDFAVALYSDRSGQVVGVDFMLSGP